MSDELRTVSRARWLVIALTPWLVARAALAAELPAIDAARVLAHTKVLASDEFEGRAPGTAGEQRTIDYLVRQFKALGLKPGNPNGTFLQAVPMVGISSRAEVQWLTPGSALPCRLPEDCVAWTRRFEPKVSVSAADVVFVGYGVEAPEFGWDDYKGRDVRGKTLLMLINDPPVPDPDDPAKLDETIFQGRAMTYYGRWTYKFEVATRKGAAAVIIIHETEPAAYPWSVVVESNTHENFDLDGGGRNRTRVPVEGWMTHLFARELFRACGSDYDQLKANAARKEFQPVQLPARASFAVNSTLRRVKSHNVAARLPGVDPQLAKELIVYNAHWDHLGRDAKLSGDQIYNGAFDNASGVAGVLELARCFAASPVRPRRSVMFLSVTAEEKGLLGARYYVLHPLHPLARTVAILNMDGLNPIGPTRDVEQSGPGLSTLDAVLAQCAGRLGRVVKPDSEPQRGAYFRSDHFEFARGGVPGLYFKEGIDFIGQPADFGRQRRLNYIAEHYHRVSDEVQPDWSFSGAAADLELWLAIGRELAGGAPRPEWKPGARPQPAQ